MSGNTGRPPTADFKVVGHTLAATFKAFDSLPKDVRNALNDARFKYDPVWIARQWKYNRKERTPTEFVRDMKAHFIELENSLLRDATRRAKEET